MARSLLSLLFALIVLVACVSSGSAQDSSTTLSNADVLTMVEARLPSVQIIEKINTSRCHFDTFPSVLSELRYRGVPEEVLRAMIRASQGGRPPVSEDAKPEPQSQVNPGNSIGGVILREPSATPHNARFFVAPMYEGFEHLITAMMIGRDLPIFIVQDESSADFILTGGPRKDSQNWYDRLDNDAGSEQPRTQGTIRIVRVRDKNVIWTAPKDDRSAKVASLSEAERRKVAERLVKRIQKDLF
jgi:hypothetical protein